MYVEAAGTNWALLLCMEVPAGVGTGPVFRAIYPTQLYYISRGYNNEHAQTGQDQNTLR